MPATRKVRRGKIQFESSHYRVYENQPHILYAAKDAEIPDILVRDSSSTLDAKKYVPYKYRHRFNPEDNDCLQFAEGLAKGVVGYSDSECVYAVGQRKFGSSDKKNIRLAIKHRKDAAANPRKGQAYAIVRTNLFEALEADENAEVAPYHIAYVIAEDGDWRITLEANAGDPDLKKPEFGIYSTKETSESFHALYEDLFGGKGVAATIVLEKNDAGKSGSRSV